MSEFTKIRELLDSPNEELRLEALRHLRGEKGELLPLLLRLLGDASWRVRKEAVTFYVAQPWALEMADEVIGCLHDPDNAGLRNSSTEILTQLGSRVLPFLIDAATDPDPDVRKFVLDIMGDVGSEDAVPTLLKSLKDQDLNVRSSAAENLGKLRAAVAAPELVASLSDPELLFRFSILDALTKIGEPVDEDQLFLYRDEPLLKKPLFDCLGKIGGPLSIPYLMEALGESARNVREAAVLALEHILYRSPKEEKVLAVIRGTERVELVHQLLRRDNREQKLAAISLLGRIGDRRSAPVLFDLLDDEMLQRDVFAALCRIGGDGIDLLISLASGYGGQQKSYLCYLIGETGHVGGLEFLGEALQQGGAELQLVAAQAIGRVGDEESIQILLECLRSDKDQVRRAAISSLVKMGTRFGERLGQEMLALMEHPDVRIRIGALEVLGKIGGTHTGSHLIAALKDPVAQVRQIALKVMRVEDAVSHFDQLRLALTDEDAEVRREVVSLLGRLEGEGVELLLLAAQDEDIWVQAQALRILGTRNEPKAVEVLLDALHSSSGLVVLAALEGLQFSEHLSMPALAQLFGHPDTEVVRTAIEILASRSPDQEFPQRLPDFLGHPDQDIRLAAVRAAGSYGLPGVQRCLEEHFARENDAVVREELRFILGF